MRHNTKEKSSEKKSCKIKDYVWARALGCMLILETLSSAGESYVGKA